VKLFALRNINSTCDDTLLAKTSFQQLHLPYLLFSLCKYVWGGGIFSLAFIVFPLEGAAEISSKLHLPKAVAGRKLVC
jgi:hypothetical protein